MLATLEERVESELPFEIDELKELGRRTTKFSELSDKNLKRLQITINVILLLQKLPKYLKYQEQLYESVLNKGDIL